MTRQTFFLQHMMIEELGLKIEVDGNRGQESTPTKRGETLSIALGQWNIRP